MELDSGYENLGFVFYSFLFFFFFFFFIFLFHTLAFFLVISLPVYLNLLYWLAFFFHSSPSAFHCLSPCLPLLLCEADYCCQQGNETELETQAL